MLTRIRSTALNSDADLGRPEIMMIKFRAWEPANFLAAPAPDFFSKRLRLQGAKNTRLRLPSPDKIQNACFWITKNCLLIYQHLCHLYYRRR